MTDFTFIKHGTFNFQVKDISGGAGTHYAYAVVPVDASGNVITGGGGGGGVVTQPTASLLNATVVGTGTFAVQSTLQAGSNLIGKVGIDQTTPGTTNGVSVTNTTLAVTQSGTWSDTVVQTTAANLNAQVVGNVASGSVDSGNGVKVSAVYLSSKPAYTNTQRADLQSDTRGNLQVSLFLQDTPTGISGGSGADAASNASSGLLTNSRSAVFNGTTWDRSRSITGAVADGTGLGVTAVEQAGALFNNISTATTTTVKSGKTILHKIVLNTYVASATITLYDNTAASGTKIGTITLPSTITGDTPTTLPYDLQCSTGLTIVTSGATDITVIYR